MREKWKKSSLGWPQSFFNELYGDILFSSLSDKIFLTQSISENKATFYGLIIISRTRALLHNTTNWGGPHSKFYEVVGETLSF